MAKREFMQLAHAYNPAKHGIGGWYMSEKLDGQRCFWDGGITRGMLKSDVPWANTNKDHRYKVAPYATGLWTRYGNVIHSPDEFLNCLPSIPLDGELYVDYDRQRLRSIISRLEPSAEGWSDVVFYVFDSPPLPYDGEIKTTNFKRVLTGCKEFLADKRIEPSRSFRATYNWLQENLRSDGRVRLLEQTQLPHQTEAAEAKAREYLEEVTSEGGEGVMLRNPHSYWMPERTNNLVKMKKLDDMEGIVTGYTTGRRTALGSKLLGKMGALVLRLPSGARLELSGFTEAERELDYTNIMDASTFKGAKEWATENPEAELPSEYHATHFPRGSKVTFRYRGLSNAGIPNEARYWRKYDAV